MLGPPDDRPFAGLAPILIVVIIFIVAIFVIVLLLLFPKLRSVKPTRPLEPVVETKNMDITKEGEITGGTTGNSIDVALRMLQPDERLVVEALIKEGGSMLQKDISRELGLSRVKVHRILVRLLRRGVIEIEEYYNTNKIKLADWLKSEEK